MNRYTLLLLLSCFVSCFVACEDEEAPESAKPTLMPVEAEVTGRTTTTLSGIINIPSGSQIDEAGFIYSQVSTLPDNETESTTIPVAVTGSLGTYSVDLTGLVPDTHYFYCLYASCGNSYVRSDIRDFYTAADGAPSFAVSYSDLTESSVTLIGEMTDDGGYPLTIRGFCYKLHDGTLPTTDDNVINTTETDLTTKDFSVSLTGLTPGSTYRIRAYGINTNGDNGIGYSDETLVITMNEATNPVLSNVACTDSTYAYSITVRAQVLDEGTSGVGETGFAWTVGDNGSESRQACNRDANGYFTTTISGLTTNSTYSIRAYALNSTGTASYSEPFTYTTGTTPTVSTGTVENIQQNTATLWGTVTNTGRKNITKCGFYISTSPNPTSDGTECVAITTNGSFSYNVTGLIGLTTYYVCAFATNMYGATYGDVVSFTTGATPLTVGSTSVSDITARSVSLYALIESTGGSTITQRGFYYSKDNATPTSSDQICLSNSVGSEISAQLTGLEANTLYYVRAFAANSDNDVDLGAVQQFTTAGLQPVLSTVTASHITSGSFAVSAYVDSEGDSDLTESGFCYSTTTSAPTIDNGTVVANAGTSLYTLTATLSGLSASTAYYVRAYAKNANGQTGYSDALLVTTTSGVPGEGDKTSPGINTEGD